MHQKQLAEQDDPNYRTRYQAGARVPSRTHFSRGPEDVFISWETALNVEQFVLSLSGRDSFIADMTMLGYSTDQIAKHLSIRNQTVKRRLYRLRTRCKAALEGDPNYESQHRGIRFIEGRFIRLPRSSQPVNPARALQPTITGR